MMQKIETFNEFCYHVYDGLYNPAMGYEYQCTGYKELRRMVEQGIEPASMEEIVRWENSTGNEEIILVPDVKYLRFLHPLLRLFIVENWDYIKNLKL